MAITKKQLKALTRKAEITIGPKPWIIMDKNTDTGKYSRDNGPEHESLEDYCEAKGINEDDYLFITYYR
ncbi:MAG: hypothetical protein KJ915_09530 [Candidatus Omnitrophica bacterium]|nr:hypothetical protein [Candidatus Omnitrophota bacterium]